METNYGVDQWSMEPDSSAETNPSSDYFTTTSELINDKIEKGKNKNTKRKTLGDLAMFKRFIFNENAEERDPMDIPPNQLDIYIAAYLTKIKISATQEYQPGTLQNKLSSLARHFRDNQYPHSLTDSKIFPKTNKSLKTKQKELKQQGYGDRPNAAQEITPAEEDQIWNTEISTDDPQKLINGVWFTCQKFFGQRANEGADKCLWGDVELKSDINTNEYLQFTERATKTRSGQDINNVRSFRPKVWATPNFPDRCPVNLYKQYRARRPPHMLEPDSPFFLNINHKRRPDCPYWFKAQKMGINTLSSMMKKMATNAGVTGRKTNHSVRKTNTQRLIDAGVPTNSIMELNGWRNVSTVLKYATSSVERQEHMSDVLALNNIHYRNPLAEIAGRNKPALGYPTNDNSTQRRPLAEIQAPEINNQLALPEPPPPSNDPPQSSQQIVPSTSNSHGSSVNRPSKQPDIASLFSGVTFTGNPNITINYSCTSNHSQMSASNTQSGPAPKRIRRPVIDSDSDSD